MASTYTINNGLTQQTTGENNNTWGDILTTQTVALIDTALDSAVTLALTGASSSLAITDGAASDGRNRFLICTGALAATHTITVTPNDAEKWYFVVNNTTGGFNVVIGQGGGSGTTVAIPAGYAKLVRLDGTGTNANASEALPSPAFGGNVAIASALAVTGSVTVTAASTFSADLTVQGVKIGRGGGAIASNTRVGDTALAANTTGLGNTVVGAYTFYQLTTGSFNTGIGYAAGFQNSGNYNTAVGYTALNASAASSGNTAVGNTALLACTGSQNTAIGNQAGSAITSGTGNVLIGGNTGATIATASNNIILSDGSAVSRLHVNGSGEASLGSTPVASLALDIPSTTKAFRPPVMTTVQRDALTPVEGGVVYNSTTKKLNFYNGTAWEAITSA